MNNTTYVWYDIQADQLRVNHVPPTRQWIDFLAPEWIYVGIL